MLSVMKCFSSIGAIIMLLVGLTFTGITVFAFLNQDVFLSDENVKHQILNGMIIVSAVVVIVSILGIVGVVRKNCCLIFVYQIFLVIFLAMFIAIGVGTKMLPSIVFEGDCKVSKNSLIESANRMYEKSDAYFCKPQCPCAMTLEGLSKYSQSDRDTLTSKYTFNATNAVISTQNCAKFRNFTNNTGPFNFPDTVGSIEKFLECSNWCPETANTNLFYRFWDVNQGKPTQTCYTALHDAFFSYSSVVGITSFAIGGLLLLVFVCNICLCCHPKKRNLQFRDRFIYVSENQAPRTQNYRRIK